MHAPGAAHFAGRHGVQAAQATPLRPRPGTARTAHTALSTSLNEVQLLGSFPPLTLGSRQRVPPGRCSSSSSRWGFEGPPPPAPPVPQVSSLSLLVPPPLGLPTCVRPRRFSAPAVPPLVRCPSLDPHCAHFPLPPRVPPPAIRPLRSLTVLLECNQQRCPLLMLRLGGGAPAGGRGGYMITVAGGRGNNKKKNWR